MDDERALMACKPVTPSGVQYVAYHWIFKINIIVMALCIATKLTLFPKD